MFSILKLEALFSSEFYENIYLQEIVHFLQFTQVKQNYHHPIISLLLSVLPFHLDLLECKAGNFNF